MLLETIKEIINKTDKKSESGIETENIRFFVRINSLST
jgi:hypothetical protein